MLSTVNKHFKKALVDYMQEWYESDWVLNYLYAESFV